MATLSRQEAIEHGQRNYRAFHQRLLPTLLPDHSGEWAVLRDEQVTGLFPSQEAALRCGAEAYPDDRFSIQEVKEEQPISLGWFSHVL